MIVNLRCKECGAIHVIKTITLKEARKHKKAFKDGICVRCEFKTMARNIAKEIVRGAKKYS